MPEACGKSSFCYSVCAEAQQQYPEKLVLYVDIEQAAHLSYMEQFGVDLDPDKFIFVQPNSIEEALVNKYYLEDLFEYYKVKEEDRLLLLQSRTGNTKNERYLLLKWLKRKINKNDRWRI